MKLKLKAPACFAPHNRAEFPGDEFECSESKGKALLADGLAEELREAPKAQPKKNGNKSHKSAN
jgi:hypothetical protein